MTSYTRTKLKISANRSYRWKRPNLKVGEWTGERYQKAVNIQSRTLNVFQGSWRTFPEDYLNKLEEHLSKRVVRYVNYVSLYNSSFELYKLSSCVVYLHVFYDSICESAS